MLWTNMLYVWWWWPFVLIWDTCLPSQVFIKISLIFLLLLFTDYPLFYWPFFHRTYCVYCRWWLLRQARLLYTDSDSDTPWDPSSYCHIFNTSYISILVVSTFQQLEFNTWILQICNVDIVDMNNVILWK